MLGNGISMLLGPALIHYDPTSNMTPGEVMASIDNYMWILSGVSGVLFGLILTYFPSKPPQTPALSCAVERTEFIKGIKALVANRNVLLVCFAYSISQVTPSCRGLMMTSHLCKLFSQTESILGWGGLSFCVNDQMTPCRLANIDTGSDGLLAGSDGQPDTPPWLH